jgi:quercetin dioxygenase-like cupin family protein
MAFTCTIPAQSTVQLDNEDFRITRWDFPPGAVTGWHSHGWPYCVVMLTDAEMCVHDGKNITKIPRKAGDSYIRPAGVQHDVMNGGTEPMAFVEVEFKRIPSEFSSIAP